MAKEKQRGTVADKGKKKITTTGKGQENSCPAVQVLRERNIGVVIRDEQDINLMRLRATEAMATEKQKGTVADKGKKKITTAGKGKENSCPVVPNNNVPSKVALAQRARRDQERNERLCFASPRERGQQLRRERERITQPLQPINFPPLTPCRRPYSCFEQQTNQTNVSPSAPKRQLVTHPSLCPISVRSTSYNPQRPTPTSELLQEDACANDGVEGVPPRVTHHNPVIQITYSFLLIFKFPNNLPQCISPPLMAMLTGLASVPTTLVSKVGCSPLHRAASTGNSELCELLIEEGAEVDATDSDAK